MDWSLKTINKPWNGFNQIFATALILIGIVVGLSCLALGVAITWTVSIVLSWTAICMAINLWGSRARGLLNK